jgi:hypothetical protein
VVSSIHLRHVVLLVHPMEMVRQRTLPSAGTANPDFLGAIFGRVIQVRLNYAGRRVLGAHEVEALVKVRLITRRTATASPSTSDDALHGGDKSVKFNRFGVEFITPRRDRLVAFSGQGVGRESNDGNIACLWIVP